MKKYRFLLIDDSKSVHTYLRQCLEPKAFKSLQDEGIKIPVIMLTSKNDPNDLIQGKLLSVIGDR
jgi:hypothetical protein